MSLTNIAALFSDIVETPQQRQQRLLAEGQASAAQFSELPTGIRELAMGIGSNIPRNINAVRRAGVDLGFDMETKSEKATRALSNFQDNYQGRESVIQAMEEIDPMRAAVIRDLFRQRDLSLLEARKVNTPTETQTNNAIVAANDLIVGENGEAFRQALEGIGIELDTAFFSREKSIEPSAENMARMSNFLEEYSADPYLNTLSASNKIKAIFALSSPGSENLTVGDLSRVLGVSPPKGMSSRKISEVSQNKYDNNWRKEVAREYASLFGFNPDSAGSLQEQQAADSALNSDPTDLTDVVNRIAGVDPRTAVTSGAIPNTIAGSDAQPYALGERQNIERSPLPRNVLLGNQLDPELGVAQIRELVSADPSLALPSASSSIGTELSIQDLTNLPRPNQEADPDTEIDILERSLQDWRDFDKGSVWNIRDENSLKERQQVIDRLRDRYKVDAGSQADNYIVDAVDRYGKDIEGVSGFLKLIDQGFNDLLIGGKTAKDNERFSERANQILSERLSQQSQEAVNNNALPSAINPDLRGANQLPQTNLPRTDTTIDEVEGGIPRIERVKLQPTLEMIYAFEGLELESYEDGRTPDGKIRYSIGYGTPSKKGEQIDEQEAKRRVAARVFEDQEKILEINNKYKFNWNENQIKALTSFAYNVGSINSLVFDKDGKKRSNTVISNMMTQYDKTKGKTNKGLSARRQAERKLFLSPVSYNAGG